MKNNKSKKIIIIILLILLFLALGYVIFLNKPKNKLDKPSSSTEEIVGLIELDINSDLVKNLIYPAANVNLFMPGVYPIYWDFINTYTRSMSNDFKVISALKLAKIETNTKDAGYKQYVTTKEIDLAIKKIFGPQEKIEHKILSDKVRNVCGVLGYFDSKKQIYHDFGSCQNAGSIMTLHIESKIIKAEQDNEAIYIYSDYTYVSEHHGKFTFYPRLPLINVGFVELPEEEELEPLTSIHTGSNIQEGLDYLSKEGKLKTYKYTFKKQADGKHYFYSGEIQPPKEKP